MENKDDNWTDDKVIEFVNWYIDLHKLDVRYKLENLTILESFKKGDDFKVWHLKDKDNLWYGE